MYLDPSTEVIFKQSCETEIDEQWYFVQNKTNQRWLWYAIDHKTSVVS